MTNDDRILVGETQPFGNQDMGWSFGPQNDTVLTIAWEIWNLQAKIEMTKNSNESLKPSTPNWISSASVLHNVSLIISNSLLSSFCVLKIQKVNEGKIRRKIARWKSSILILTGDKKTVWDSYLRNKCRGLFKRESNLIVLNLPPHPTFRFSVMEFQQWRRLFCWTALFF